MGELGEERVIGFGDGMAKPASIDVSYFKIFVEATFPASLDFVLGFWHLSLPLFVHWFIGYGTRSVPTTLVHWCVYASRFTF